MSKKPTTVKNNEEKIYEIGYHVISSVSEEALPSEVAKIKEYLAAEKAPVIEEETPKLRPLAYSIKKAFAGIYKTFDKAYFGFIKFELPEDGDITKIDAKLKGNENVLRYIVIRTVRENTMYSPKIGLFSDKEEKAKPVAPKAEKSTKKETASSAEEIDKSIDALLVPEVAEEIA